jgi:hypothetical protein
MYVVISEAFLKVWSNVVLDPGCGEREAIRSYGSATEACLSLRAGKYRTSEEVKVC